MAIHEHFRFKIFNKTQHILQHASNDFPYSNDALPSDVNSINTALDYFSSVLFPKTQPSVATVGDLPAAGNTINDYRVVEDDGDGKAAGYMWLQYDGDAAAAWKKVSDMDWGVDSVLSGLMDQTQFLFPRKYGNTDYDSSTELPLTGIDAGQHFFGGALANENLTLHANNGDAVGARTGYIQVDDSIRPTVTELLNIGTATERFNDAYIKRLFVGTGTLTLSSDGTKSIISDSNNSIDFAASALLTTGNITGAQVQGSGLVVNDLTDILTLTGSSITSNKGEISFGDEKLVTTGAFEAATALIGSDLLLGVGSITSLSGTIDFGDENIETTGTFGVGSFSADFLQIDQVKIDGNKVYTDTALTDLELEAPVGQVVKFLSNVSGLNGTFGDLTATNFLTGKITINGSSISSTEDISFNQNFIPSVDNASDIGIAGKTVRSLYITNKISDGTIDYTIGELIKLRSSAYRDVGHVTGASDKDVLSWNAAGSRFLTSPITDLITHANLSDITTGDAGHTQFAMLNGRVGGQVVYGGTIATQVLNLKSRVGATEGIVIKDGAVTPANDKLFNLGEAAVRFNDLHLWGELIGARVENKVTGDLAGMASADKVGRLVYTTNDNNLNVDMGGTFKRIGHNSYNQILTNVVLGAAVDVSATITDARNALWQLCDPTTETILSVEISKTQTTVTINTDIPLTAGNYRLIGIEL